MQRGKNESHTPNGQGLGGGLGPQLAGEKIHVNNRALSVLTQLGEGAFSFVYLVKDEPDKKEKVSNANITDLSNCNVLKITSIHSREHKEIAEKEANLLRRLNHPSIVRIIDYCYRESSPHPMGILSSVVGSGIDKTSRTQHLILMEYCQDGHAFDVMKQMDAKGERFTLTSLIIAFGQICNAVSYIHAQRPTIVHRDLKPNNFLVNRGSYKLCDFGSVIFGDVPLKTQLDRANAEEVIQKTTTQMFRAPEMVDLYMSDKLTEKTDVWALGCCLYSMAFFQNCFEEGSNLAIISNNYKIPPNNPYGHELVDLIDRMLTVDYRKRADMTEVIMCLSALYAGKKMPERRMPIKVTDDKNKPNLQNERIGSFRTNGQGINHPVGSSPNRPIEAKKLNPNSAAARRKAHRTADVTSTSTNSSSSTHSNPEMNKKTSSKEVKATNTFNAAFDNFPVDFQFPTITKQKKDVFFSNTLNDTTDKDLFHFGDFESSLPYSSQSFEDSTFSAFKNDAPSEESFFNSSFHFSGFETRNKKNNPKDEINQNIPKKYSSRSSRSHTSTMTNSNRSNQVFLSSKWDNPEI